ncbi:hypothetical protein LZD49_32360 [Dyadobacter sp. CY261]|uniref:hypothetical protein n=1 Tax=Dyadobacter sp. CY261 TaxID=2907203 RepID=UPI001F1D997F|nr:hypothetical protein [Dyadobacter sp. CY261]MCF0075221.1 hypothetical protein [Dyadobacter sp. CY261]
MPISKCDTCDGDFHWNWEEAFDKFGFGDGDGHVETWTVEAALTEAGFEARVIGDGLHNAIIVSIKKEGIEQIPETARIGYDNPRDFLPRLIVRLLDKCFPSDNPYTF